MSFCLKKYVKKTAVLTPQRQYGAITPLTPLNSEFAKLKLIINKKIKENHEVQSINQPSPC